MSSGNKVLIPYGDSKYQWTVNLKNHEFEKQDNKGQLTVDRKNHEIEKQGTSEGEVSHVGSTDLHRHLKGCNQNPTHKNVIPVYQFNVEHLPSGYHDNDLMDLVHAMSNLTVRVAVEYASERRPKNVPGSDKPYTCYSNTESGIMKVGTGWVSEVRRFRNMDASDKTCDCEECLNSPTPKSQFAHILIQTDAHVVCNKLEGAHTTCDLFFDSGITTDVCKSVVTLSGLSNVSSDVATNHCLMKHVTHNLDLVDRLDTMRGHYHEILQRINNKYVCNIFDMVCQPPPTTRQSLTIIVSHPHGCSKYVSVGQWTQRNGNVDSVQTTNTTTKTCPGSDGALMLIIENKKLIKSTHRQSKKGEENCRKALLPIAAILCIINVILTIWSLVAGEYIQHEILEYEDAQRKICIDCIKLSETYDSSQLEKRSEDGIQKCCTTTPEQVSAILEQVLKINKEGDINGRTDDSFTFTPVSVHKQLHAPYGEDNLTEPLFNEGHNVAMLMSDKVDPILEHARGVTVTNDSLIILYPGIYFIYSSVHYKPVSDHPAGEFQHQSWFHYIHRTSNTNPDNSGTLLQTAHSVCDNCTNNEETAFTGGTFYLEIGDEIQVCYSSLGLVDVKQESTFVGLMKLGSGSNDE